MTAATVSLSNLCDLVGEPVRPGTHPGSLYLGLEHLASGRLVRIGGGKASEMRSTTSAFRSGDVLYGKLRPYLDKAILAQDAGVCTPELLVLRPRPDVAPRFLAALLHSRKFVEYAVMGITGVQHPRTSWAHIREYRVPALAIAEQRRIGDFLWLVHETAAQSDRVVEEAKSLKRAAMRSLFTRGLRREAQKQTEIGPVPKSWRVVGFAEMRHRLQYGTSTRCTYDDSGHPVLRIPNIAPQRISSADLKYCGLSPSAAERFRLERGDLLFIRTNGVLSRLGSCAVYSDEPHDALFASYLIRASLHLEEIDPYFASYFFSSYGGAKLITGRATPASDGKYNLNKGAIDSLPLPLPSLEEQRDIVSILDAIDRKIDLHERKRAVLEDLSKALLHDFLSGTVHPGELDLPVLTDNITVAKAAPEPEEDRA